MNAEICLPRIWLLHQLQQLRWYARLVRLAPCLVIFALALEGYCLAIRRLEWPSGAALAAAGAAACALAFANALNDLVDTAYRQNLTLLSAGTRVLEARAQLGVARPC